MPAPSTDFVKSWCRIDGAEFDATLPSMIASAAASASHEVGVDYSTVAMPESVEIYCAAVVAQWIANPEAGADARVVKNPFLAGLLDPYRTYA